jgi:hypothetical protein
MAVQRLVQTRSADGCAYARGAYRALRLTRWKGLGDSGLGW